MKQELDIDYDIIVTNMESFTFEDFIPHGWRLSEATFPHPDTLEDVTITVMDNGKEELTEGYQKIIKMKDGLFILEEDTEESTEYYFSSNINDLI